MPSQPLPLHIRTVEVLQTLRWLRLGWEDTRRAGWVSLLHGTALAGAGLVMVLLARHNFWLLASAVSAFMVVAPVLATSLYALSRAMERGQAPSLAIVVQTWLQWQRSHRNKWGNDYWCLVQFGALLGLAAAGWLLVSAALITLLVPMPVDTPLQFLQYVVVANHGHAFEIWLALGGVLAAPIFASSVITIPLLLDRRVGLWPAVLASWQAVLVNPVPLALWAALIAGLTLLGIGVAMLGLIPVISVLGHGSWHAYRDLLGDTDLPVRAD